MKRGTGITTSAELSALLQFAGFSKRIFLSLDFRPILPSDDILERPDIVYTYGYFCLRYGKPFTLTPSQRKKGISFFFFGDTDILATPKYRGRLANYSSYEDFMSKAHLHPFQNFVSKCSTLSAETFRLAKENPNVPIPFVIDLLKYREVVGQETFFTTDGILMMDAVATATETGLGIIARKGVEGLNPNFKVTPYRLGDAQ